MPPIILPRRTLHAFRTALKKHLGLKARDDGPPVRVDAAEDGGARLTAIAPDGRGVSLAIPGDRPLGDLVLPFELLADAGAAKSGDVQLSEADGGEAVVASWDERGMPRSARGTLEKADRGRAAKFDVPAVEAFRDPGPGFAAALRQAVAVTDAESTRDALGCVRLDPHAGRIEATDSHCLLIARGFTFGFEEPVLLPAPHALGRSPLKDAEVRIARVTDGPKVPLVVLSAGDWTLWAPEARDARFPDLDRVVPSQHGKTTVSLSEADAAFLLDRIASLPGAGDGRKPVTLEAKDNKFLIRAAEEGGTPVELVTASSQVRGTAICVADRRFVARALATGCRKIVLNGPEEPVRCDAAGDGRPGTTLVFATLAGDPVPAKDAVRLTGEAPASAAPAAAVTPAKRPATPMPANRLNGSPADPAPTNGHAANGHPANGHAANGHAANGHPAAADSEALLDRATALQATLADAAAEAKGLAADLRKLKRRDRLVSSALGSLKRLGSLTA
ncbi:hypothetical protein [Alienimonas sp. DA493]|uniref:hypothetical protein n=1 Tax=Alienimonas sp. DA493 TaxID=3373605 RepID=UPI0037548445